MLQRVHLVIVNVGLWSFSALELPHQRHFAAYQADSQVGGCFLHAFVNRYPTYSYNIMAAAKTIILLLRLAVERAGCTRVTQATFSSNSRNIMNSSRHNTEPLPEFLLPFLRERNASLLFHRSFRLSRASCHDTQSKRNFSSSPAPKAVAATINPRKDEEGNDMLIDITSRAATVRHPAVWSDDL